MSRYILIRRLRGPAVLLLIGLLALLHEAGVIPYFWRLFWPLLFIMLGLLLLAERAALAVEGYPAMPNSPWHGGWQETSQQASQGAQQTQSTAIVSSEPHDFGDHQSGAQS